MLSLHLLLLLSHGSVSNSARAHDYFNVRPTIPAWRRSIIHLVHEINNPLRLCPLRSYTSFSLRRAQCARGGGGGRLFPQPAPRYKRFYGKPLRQSLTRKCFRSMSIAPPITRFARRTRHAVKMSSLWTRCPRYLCRSRPSPNFIFSFARDPIVFSLALLHSNNVDRWKERFRTRLLKISRRLPEYLTK